MDRRRSFGYAYLDRGSDLSSEASMILESSVEIRVILPTL